MVKNWENRPGRAAHGAGGFGALQAAGQGSLQRPLIPDPICNQMPA